MADKNLENYKNTCRVYLWRRPCDLIYCDRTHFYASRLYNFQNLLKPFIKNTSCYLRQKIYNCSFIKNLLDVMLHSHWLILLLVFYSWPLKHLSSSVFVKSLYVSISIWMHVCSSTAFTHDIFKLQYQTVDKSSKKY